MEVQITEKSLCFVYNCLSVYLSVYLFLFLSLKVLPEVHLSFLGLWLEFNEISIAAHRKTKQNKTKNKQKEKLSLVSRGIMFFALGWQSDTTIERAFTHSLFI